jgi:Polyketide cyclase / dehydrase and lipid transport
VTGSGAVPFPVPAEVAFDYLADPANRPAWQSSLARVEKVTGEPRIGQRWVDVTRPGLRPAMETTELDRPHRWAEIGRWRGLRAALALTFVADDPGCEVVFEFTVEGDGLLRPVGTALTAVAVPAVRADLRRAADILSRRS